MTINKDIAWSYFERLNEGRMHQALDVLNDAGTWWHCRERVAYPMLQQKTRVLEGWPKFSMRFTLHRAFEDGNVVLLELESHANVAGGGTYNNVYIYVIEVWDGTILHAREYNDTHHYLTTVSESIDVIFHPPGEPDGR